MSDIPAKLILKNSNKAGTIPPAHLLSDGELALNYTDGKLFYKDGDTVSALNIDVEDIIVNTVNPYDQFTYFVGDIEHLQHVGEAGYTKIFNTSFVSQTLFDTLTLPDHTQLRIGKFVTTLGPFNDIGIRTRLYGQLELPNTLTTLATNAFSGCINLTGNIRIPGSLSMIETSAFESCTGFTSIEIEHGVTQIYDLAFKDCSGLTGNLLIPNSVTLIRHNAFKNCNGFNGQLTLSNSLTQIQDGAFSGCTGFTGNLIIPNSVTRIDSTAFRFCSFDKIVFGNGLTTVWNNSFQNVTAAHIYSNVDASVFGWTTFSDINPGPIYVTSTHIASYGGIGTTYQNRTVAEWTTYPNLMP
jgi:hypothetical protein